MTTREFIEGLLERIGQRAFRVDDEFARRHGWQVTPDRRGLRRIYRHPGFDRLASCPDCHGSGLVAEATCDRCSGTGRVTLGRAATARR
jgi:RecJ-like exonuclease